MDSKFDIFRKLPDAKPLWMGVAEGLEEAKKRVNCLAQTYPGEYFIFSLKDGAVVERVTESQISEEACRLSHS